MLSYCLHVRSVKYSMYICLSVRAGNPGCVWTGQVMASGPIVYQHQ